MATLSSEMLLGGLLQEVPRWTLEFRKLVLESGRWGMSSSSTTDWALCDLDLSFGPSVPSVSEKWALLLAWQQCPQDIVVAGLFWVWQSEAFGRTLWWSVS